MAASPLRAFGAHRVQSPFEGRIDTRRRRALRDQARALPRTPGVYFFYGLDDRLLYVGKSKTLRDRVRSYFAETKQKRTPKLRRLLAEIQRMEVRFCGSELEALLLERKLIAQLRPILNRQLKRFDVYPYLLLSHETFPRLTLTRAEPCDEAGEDSEHEASVFDELPTHLSSLNNDAARRAMQEWQTLDNPPRAGELPGLYLGPFTTPRAAWWTFEAVRNLFPLRSCEGELRPDPTNRACFYHELKRCAGPCVDAIEAAEYQQICAELVQTLHEGTSPRVERMRARMNELAAEWRFEDAGKIKEQLEAIAHVADRLQRLKRMREDNNLVIMQPALSDKNENDGASTCSARWSAFLVCGGIVRRHVIVSDSENDWARLKSEIEDVFSDPPPVAPFTAKSELDEMLILNRWLSTHGKEPCCVWLCEKPSRLWATNAMRKCRKWTRAQIKPLS